MSVHLDNINKVFINEQIVIKICIDGTVVWKLKHQVNPNLQIYSTAMRSSSVTSGKEAMLLVKTDEAAKKLAIMDAAGNEVKLNATTYKVIDGIATYQAKWTVTGNRGDVIPYTVVVYDENGFSSVNTQEVSIRIK